MGSRRSHKVFSQYSQMYNWKTLHCELCQSPYPFKVSYDGKVESLLEYDIPNEPYLAFETFLKEGSDKATSKSVYILNLKDIGTYRIGRSHEVEFHVEDISVSRIHGELQVTKDKLYMQDYKSKYGTQILIKGEQSLDKVDCTKNMFQVGRAWLMATYVKKSSGLFSCCFKKKQREASPEIEGPRSGQKQDKAIQETNQNMLDSNLYSKLEHDIENLQKDRDSVFHLDDEFYNKLVHLYHNQDAEDKPRRTTEVYENRETIDDVRIAESKEEEPSSESESEDANSYDSEGEESGDSESILESKSSMMNEPSLEGIGANNQLSQILSRTVHLERALPK